MVILAYVADEIPSSPWADDLFFAQAAAGGLALWRASERTYTRKSEIFGPVEQYVYGNLYVLLPRQHISQKLRVEDEGV